MQGVGTMNLRMAVVFYSGWCCDKSDPQAYSYGFGTPEEISRQTSQEKTQGGCGSSADVWSGLRLAVNLPWRQDARKFIFLIGDEPGHNQQDFYANELSKSIVPSFSVRDIVRDMIQKNIQFVGSSITPQVALMNRNLATLYDGPGRKFKVASLSGQYNPEEFQEIMLDLIQTELHNYVL